MCVIGAADGSICLRILLFILNVGISNTRSSVPHLATTAERMVSNGSGFFVYFVRFRLKLDAGRRQKSNPLVSSSSLVFGRNTDIPLIAASSHDWVADAM